MMADTKALMDRVYRHERTRERVAAELRKRSDVAINGIMSLLAETYLDGARDGDAFGLRSVCEQAWTDEAS